MNLQTQYHPQAQYYTLSNAFKWAIIVMLIYFTVFNMMPAFAIDNPLNGITVVQGKQNDVGGTMSWAIKIFGTGILSIAILWAFSSLLFSLVASLRDSLQKQAWGEFFMFLMILFIALAVVIILGNFGFTVLLKLKDIITEILK